MNEVAQILDLWRTCRQRGEEAVLATVIRTRGSSYRLPGARLLLTGSGKRAGSISGGCLEDDLVKKAWWLTGSGPVVRRYDTTPDGDIGPAYGLGCNGIIHVHLQRLKAAERNVLDLIADVWCSREPAEYIHPAVDSEPPFVETLHPPIRLLIFGAGDDAIPVCQLADFMGWQVCVYDGRFHYARRERFPNAREVMAVPAGEADLTVDRWTVAILMTHSYSQDLGFLKQLAPLRPAYLGMLGPRKRSLQLFADANLSPADLAPQLHAPVGLDIGADGPHQVALSVLAEIQSFLNGREGGELRERKGPIHSRAEGDTADEVFRVPAIACS